MEDNSDSVLSSSTGHDYSESSYLDNHFVACQPEYEEMLKSVGLKAGWHVLDAGCGSGAYLPLMSEERYIEASTKGRVLYATAIALIVLAYFFIDILNLFREYLGPDIAAGVNASFSARSISSGISISAAL